MATRRVPILDGSDRIPAALLPVGTAAGTVAAGDAPATAVAAHDADTTNVNGSADTATLETTSGAQTKANNAATAATAAAAALVDDLSGVSNPAAARTNLGLGNAAVLNVGTTGGTVAAGNAPATAQAAAEATAANLYLPKTGGEIVDSTFTVRKNDNSSALRFRSTGGSVDLDKTNGDVVLSSFAGPGFAGTQTGLQRWRGNGTTIAGLTEFGSTVYAAEQSINATTGVAALGAKNGLSNIRLAGFSPTPGPPGTGTWATGDVVLDSAGRWHLCTTGGTPGTWTTGAASPITVASGHVVSGNITPQNTGGGWQLLTGGPTFSVVASAGDRIRLDWSALIEKNSNTYWDACVIVSGAAARYSTTGTSTPGVEGDPGVYPDTAIYQGRPGPFTFVAQPGDITGGNVTFGFAVKSAGAGTLYAGTAFPLRYTITNYRA